MILEQIPRMIFQDLLLMRPITGQYLPRIPRGQHGRKFTALLQVRILLFIIAVPQTISFPALPVMTYGDLPVTLTATAPSGLPVTFTSSNTSVATLSGNILTANSTGTADIIAMQTGNGTYAPARYIRILTVNKADQTIPML
jgi:hypothetical protein